MRTFREFAPGYIKRLRMWLRDKSKLDAAADTTLENGKLSQVQTEPLSDRECDVLALLATHLSGPEIAAQLQISPNTVKTHIRNIYSKLEVNSRNDAVIQAQIAGLL